MQLIYIKDRIYISWDTELPAEIHWWHSEAARSGAPGEIKLGRLTITYS